MKGEEGQDERWTERERRGFERRKKDGCKHLE